VRAQAAALTAGEGFDNRTIVTLPIGILASGTGTNFDAIAGAIDTHRLDARIAIVVCNRADAAVLAKARARGLRTALLEHREFPSRSAFDAAVADTLGAAGVELVVMAGFDRVVTSVLLERFPNRVLNIHPALLPAFRGTDAQEQAARHGVAIAGATVHIVDAQVDHGPIVVQVAVPAVPGESPDALRARILTQEHRIYPHAIQLFAEGRVHVRDGVAVVDGRAAPGDECLVSPPLPGR
jgi:phosphoribosylglycinamide formyltransferase-1